MRPDLTAPHLEMVNSASEAFSAGTNLLADGYGPGDGEGWRNERSLRGVVSHLGDRITPEFFCRVVVNA